MLAAAQSRARVRSVRASTGVAVSLVLTIACGETTVSSKGVTDHAASGGAGGEVARSSGGLATGGRLSPGGQSSGAALNRVDASPSDLDGGSESGRPDAAPDVVSDASTEATTDAKTEAPVGVGPAFADVGDIQYFAPIGNYGGDFMGIAADPSSAAWVTYGSSVARITANGDFTSYAVPLAEDGGATWAGNVAASPDGSAWFATGRSKIGNVTAEGVFTLFPVPVPDSTLFDIACGPDGLVWFTNPSAGTLGKMTPSGDVTQYPASVPPWDNPSFYLGNALTTGAGGNVRYASFQSNDAGGSFGVGAVPNDAGSPSVVAVPPFASIALDSLGAVWLAEDAEPTVRTKIRRVDPSGAVEELPIACTDPTPNTFVMANRAFVASSPLGPIWFTEGAHATIGRMDPSTREVACFHAFARWQYSGLAAYPSRLAPARDGSVWFTETLSFSGWSRLPPTHRTFVIGRLTPP